jgi:hypothetical protein
MAILWRDNANKFLDQFLRCNNASNAIKPAIFARPPMLLDDHENFAQACASESA